MSVAKVFIPMMWKARIGIVFLRNMFLKMWDSFGKEIGITLGSKSGAGLFIRKSSDITFFY